jgi:tRNA nucleotidyltransferase (CCA-adding enzyme)
VGGCVRDLLKGVPLRDLDLVVEGDPRGLGQDLARRIHGRPGSLTPFQTCTVEGPGGLRIDLALSRREWYAEPAALPRVVAAPIEEDLLRRDFTVNSLAIGLTGPLRGRLLDPSRGRADLRARRLRPHHRETLVDDPTRGFRGARYAARFGLRTTPLWKEALRAAVHARSFRRLSASRLRRELALIWDEADPAAALSRCHRWGLLAHLHPRLRWGPDLARVIRKAKRMGSGSDRGGAELLFASLAWALPAGSRRGLAGRLELQGEALRQILDAASAPARAERLLGRARGGSDASAFRRMERLARWSDAEVRMVEAAAGARVRSRLEECRDSWARQQPILRGDEIIALGVPRGPLVGLFLREIHAARIAGRVRSRADEVALVRSQLDDGRP